MHDWAVEAMLDRIGEALRTGDMPRHTTRPVPFPTRVIFAATARGMARAAH